MKRRLLLLGLTLLGACASRPPAPAHERLWSGRLALSLQGDSPQQWHALFELQGSAQAGELRLFSPVGSLLARLSWTPEQALLERGQERQSAATVEDLMRRLAGTPMPVDALFDWLQGRPVPHGSWQPDLSALAQGRINARRSQPEAPALLRIVLDQ